MKTTRFTDEQIIAFLKQAEAGVALGQLMVLDHLANRLAFDLWG